MPIRLHVNVDHIATIRQARGTSYPDPIFGAQLCEAAGADGITIHLREDRRHIIDSDVRRMREALTTVLNLECAATEEMIAIARQNKANVVTFVPERREERTTEGGLNVVAQREWLKRCVSPLREAGIKVSLFIAPEEAQIEASLELNVNQVELHTGPYAHAQTEIERNNALKSLHFAAHFAASQGLDVAAGHGLTRQNVVAIARISAVEELNIGHAIIADAIMMGLEKSVFSMKESIARGIQLRS